ncbi:hypothetical protein [Acinetobacter wanghuae]|uniref:hypothetical protein n=1 Tax=Acinetobacter wanghuae TaxID=2662362 RepID=UPI003AF8DBC8
MKKSILWISLGVVIAACLLCFWLMYPNAELRGKHQATLCNVVRLSPELNTQTELLQRMHFIYDNSTPTYAYHHPKFYEFYSKYLIDQFVVLDEKQKQQLRDDFEACRAVIQ